MGLRPSRVDQKSRVTRARARRPAVSTSSPGHLWTLPVVLRGQTAAPGDSRLVRGHLGYTSGPE